MNQKIVLMNKKEVEVTESEFKTIMKANDLVYIPRLQMSINKKGIAHTEPVGGPAQAKDLLEARKKNQEGILHDGTLARRVYGTWRDPNGDYDAAGTTPITHFSPQQYPEIARDCVPSPAEYHEKYAELPAEERLKAILGDVNYSDEGKYLPRSGGFKQIGEAVKELK